MILNDSTNFLYLKSEVNSNNESDGNNNDKHDKEEGDNGLIALIDE